MSRDWLRSFTVMRQSDAMLCHVWVDGGSNCDGRGVPVRAGSAGSHLSLADYHDAAMNHLKDHHPKEAAEVAQ